MKNTIKRVSALLMAGMLALTALPTNVAYADEVKMSGNQEIDANDIVILYTNDVHNGYEHEVNKDTGAIDCLGYSSVAWFKKEIAKTTTNIDLVDNGDAIQGGLIGTLSKGEYLVDIMNKVGYTYAVPGNHEYDFGMERFLELAGSHADYKYVSCNFMDLKKNDTVFSPYEMKEYDVDGAKVKVAFIGITTPESFTKSTPTYFQDDKGNYIYGFCEGNNGKNLIAQVQKTVDAAKAAGAEYVIALSHTGNDEASVPYDSETVLKGTSGIDVCLDGHSHSTIEGQTLKNKDGKDVLLTSTGTKLAALGELVIDKSEGTITSSLVKNITEEDAETKDFVDGISSKFEDLKNKVVAHSEIELVVNDPETEKRMVRNQETNLGDLCADAYKDQFGADCAIVNGGGIRANIKKGDVTFGDIVAVHPFGNVGCLAEVTGQQILDCLEMTARGAYEEEVGGFMQVSGITYDIDTTIKSSVVLDDKANFVKVDGERRVKNVKINGEAISASKKYTLATHNYALKSYGDGLTMFKGAKILIDETIIDNQVLINYIVDTLGGTIKADSKYANPYGQGRIRVIVSKDTKDGCFTILEGSKEKVVEHTLSKVNEVPATCKDTGVKEHYICNVCNKLFADASGKTEVKAADLVINKTEDHCWDKGTVTKKPTLKKKGERTYKCTVCGATKTEKLAKLKSQTIKGKSFTKTYKYSSLKKAKKTFTIAANGKTALSFSVSGKTAKKYITVSSKGKVTLKKKTPKGTYKIVITARETLKYAKATKTFVIKVK